MWVGVCVGVVWVCGVGVWVGGGVGGGGVGLVGGVVVVVMTTHFTHFGNTVPASEIPCTLRMTVSSDRHKAGCGVTQGVGVVALPSLELRPV